jgi:nucleotide-binding universal stress UspA family protein
MTSAVKTQAPVFRKVVVPLDGGAVAEEIFGHLLRMKEAIGDMLLLHVVPALPLPTGAPPTIQSDMADQAERYLSQAGNLVPRSRIQFRVETGDAAERIAAVCTEVDADLLAFTTHSQKGLGSILFGSTARRLLSRCSLPMLLARPGLPPTSGRIERILMPVGLEAGEEALLGPVGRLAQCLDSEITLFRTNTIVVAQDPLTGLVLPLPFVGSPAQAATSLDKISQSNPEVRTRVVVVEGNVAPAILEQARKMRADLVAMTTHARTGIDRILMGSFAEEVFRDAAAPVLLQHQIPPSP